MAAAFRTDGGISGDRSRGIFSGRTGARENQSGPDRVSQSFGRTSREAMTRPSFLFAPGAGAPSSHPWMQRWKERLARIGDVATFDYDYMRRGSRRPDPLPLLIAAHRQALRDARTNGQAVILIGKSMGGRIGCHVSLEEQVTALVCLSYPLCGGGDPRKLRDKVLRELRTPVLFVQ